MKLQDLHVLMVVAQVGSMGKAAERLNTSQPNISRSIAELERTFGVTLLDRHRQGVKPTEFGRALLDCGTVVFDDLRHGIKNIEFLSDPTAGEVRIGCNPLLAATFVSTVVSQLSRRNPRIVFHLLTAPVETLKRELSERNVDLLIIRKFGPLADDRMIFDPLFDDTYVIAASVQSPWAKRRKLQFAELTGEPWVLPPPETVIGSIAREAFRGSGLDYPRTSVVAVPPEVRISLLSSGRFLTILPASALQFPVVRPEIKALSVRLPVAHAPNGIVTMKNRALSPVARLLIDEARETAKPLARRRL